MLPITFVKCNLHAIICRMIKNIQILTWCYLGFYVLTFAMIIILSSIGPNHLSPSLAAIYNGFCTAGGKCVAGQSMTGYQLGYVFGSIFLPVMAIIGLLLVALYRRSRGAYYVALAAFVVVFVSQLGHGRFSFPALLFIVVLLLNPVRRYFKKDLVKGTLMQS